MQCNQKGCTQPAAFRFTWPGQDEAGICALHEPKLQHVSNAMGLHLQLIPIHVGPLRRSPIAISREIAARVWCDAEMEHIAMDVEAAEEIARIIERVLAKAPTSL